MTTQSEKLLDVDRRGASLYELPAGSEPLRLIETAELTRNAQSDVVVLGDNSLVYATASSLQRGGPPRGAGPLPTAAIAWELAAATELAPGPGTDTLWAASASEIHLVQLAADRAFSQRSLPVPGSIFQLESALGHIGVLRFEELPGQPVRWTLSVSDEAGQPQLKVELPAADALAGGVIPPAALANKCLRLSADLAALGGPTRLLLWDLHSGRQLLDHAA